jgi:hypothetical protein
MIPEALDYDYKARTYDPTLGRFLQPDPAIYQSDINPYSYAGGSPINLTDPTGMVSAQCNPPNCHWINFGGSGYVYDNGTTSVYCSSGSFQSGYTPSGDCYAYQDQVWQGGYDFTSTSYNGPSGTGRGSRGGNQLPDCNTILPNGITIGQYVRTTLAFSAGIRQANFAAGFGADLAMVSPYGPLDPKNNFRGQGSPSQLAAAGNFEVGAYMTAVWGSGVSNLEAIIYATGSHILGIKASSFMAPNGMDKSAAANLPRGNANAGCPASG